MRMTASSMQFGEQFYAMDQSVSDSNYALHSSLENVDDKKYEEELNGLDSNEKVKHLEEDLAKLKQILH